MTARLQANKGAGRSTLGAYWMAFMGWLWSLPRHQKRAVQLFADAVLIVVVFLVAMFLRFDHWSFLNEVEIWYPLAITLPITLLLFARMGLYRAVVRYVGGKALRTVAFGALASGVALLLFSQTFRWPVPRSVPIIYTLLLLVSVGGVRYLMRALFARVHTAEKARVLIYGAGESGRQLCSSLREGPEFSPVAFMDDNPELQGSIVSGLRVHASSEAETLVEEYQAKMILLATPSASRTRRAAILTRLELLPVQVRTIPGMADVVSGNAKISEIREVSIEDLLGRDPVPPRPDLMSANIRDKCVLVSGAGGSIGSELCRQVLRFGVRRLILFENSEFSLYAVERELLEIAEREGIHAELSPVLGSVQDADRVGTVLRHFSVQTVYHAAAYKHVPLVEYNVVEGVRNNIFGTRALAREAVQAGVESFILISTDKAVRPTNVMGASKRMAELVCQGMARSQAETCFSMVRFGNVLGSSGSVIPHFQRQIERGGPITVTHPEITRYFMTIPEASQLVIQAGAMARGGDVFLLDMGKPTRIADLAARMARLSGLKPMMPGETSEAATGQEIEIVFSGLRPGEKLYEELLIADDASGTDHPRILTATEASLPLPELEVLLEDLAEACDAYDIASVREILMRAPTGYGPRSPIVDPLSRSAEASASTTAQHDAQQKYKGAVTR